MRVNFTGAENLKPAAAVTNFAFAVTVANRTRHVDFSARLGERKEAGAQTNFGTLAKNLLAEKIQRADTNDSARQSLPPRRI